MERGRGDGGLSLAEAWTLACLAFVLANLAASCALKVRPESPYRGPGPIARYGMPMLMTPGVYEGYGEDDVRELLVETYRSVTLEPFTMFRETVRTGRYVNVSDDGYRVIERQGPWPPVRAATNVFVFGGSTTFGYGVADSETIPSRLQAALFRRLPGVDLAVYHFGRGYYYSTQERILFEQLLTRGIDIDVALFIDGANEKGSADVPSLFYDLVEANRRASGGVDMWESAAETVALLPISRVLGGIRRWIGGKEPASEEEIAEGDARAAGRGALERYLRNRDQLQAVGRASGTNLAFVWQPLHWLDFDPAHHPFGGLDPDSHFMQRYLYEEIRTYLAQAEPPDFIDASWLSRDEDRPLYVDRVHYNAYFSERIAEHIADWLAPRVRESGRRPIQTGQGAS